MSEGGRVAFPHRSGMLGPGPPAPGPTLSPFHREFTMEFPGLRALRRLLSGGPAVLTAPGRVTFAVSDVTPATTPLPEAPYHQAVANFLAGPVEACTHYHGRLVAHVRSHPLLAALHAAFCQHRPVCLSPDILWLTLTQGLAHHV